MLYHYEDSEKFYKLYVELSKDMSQMYMVGLCQLHQYKLVEGMCNYKYRWLANAVVAARRESLGKVVPYLASWDQLKGKRLCVIGEQGLGDDIMFSSVYSIAAGEAKSVYVLARQELRRLFKYNADGYDVFDGEQYQTTDEEISANYDFMVTTGDLFSYYVIKNRCLPSQPVYKCDSPIQVNPGTIAVVTRTGILDLSNLNRSVSPGCIHALHDNFGFLDCNDPRALGLFTFMDTANILQSTIGTVTVDTSMAHISLCTDRPTVVMYDKYLDWRFKLDYYKKPLVISVKQTDFIKEVTKFLKQAY
jgi:hypothetical protein